jgi:hypothetical protein
MKHILIISLFIIPFVSFGQRLKFDQDRMFKKHADSCAYYDSLCKAEGFRNVEHFKKIETFREKASQRQFEIEDSVYRGHYRRRDSTMKKP